MGQVIVAGEISQFARLLLAIRKQRGWTQAQLANELCISVRTLRDWEHNRRQGNTRDLSLLRTLLDPTLANGGWAHVVAQERILSDAKAGTISPEATEALLETMHLCRLALLGVAQGGKEHAA